MGRFYRSSNASIKFKYKMQRWRVFEINLCLVTTKK